MFLTVQRLHCIKVRHFFVFFLLQIIFSTACIPHQYNSCLNKNISTPILSIYFVCKTMSIHIHFSFPTINYFRHLFTRRRNFFKKVSMTCYVLKMSSFDTEISWFRWPISTLLGAFICFKLLVRFQIIFSFDYPIYDDNTRPACNHQSMRELCTYFFQWLMRICRKWK